VQQEILDRHPDADLRVYALWIDMLAGDARDQWDAAGLTDRRVTHLWDGPNTVGRWVAANLDGYEGSDWDFFLLFGPDASWNGQPAPLMESGFTVVREGDALRGALQPLLSP
jgi:hypothetical protein